MLRITFKEPRKNLDSEEEQESPVFMTPETEEDIIVARYDRYKRNTKRAYSNGREKKESKKVKGGGKAKSAGVKYFDDEQPPRIIREIRSK